MARKKGELTYLNTILLSLGFAIVIGVMVGVIFKNEKYYYTDPKNPKREVSKELYIHGVNEPFESQYNFMKERRFNLEQALVWGFATFGLSLILFTSINKTGKS